MNVEISMRIIAHATEDEELLKEKASSLFNTEFKIKKLFGYWNNPIYVIEGSLKKENALNLLKKLLNIFSIEEILDNFDEEEKSSYLRINKEALLNEEIKKKGSIQIKIHFKDNVKIDKKKVEVFLNEIKG